MPTTVKHLGRKVNYGDGGLSVTNRYQFAPYSDERAMLAFLLGGIEIIGGDVWRFPPHRDPVYPWLFCTEASSAPLDQGQLVSGYSGSQVGALPMRAIPAADFGIVEAVYRTPSAGQLADIGGDVGGDTGQQNDEAQEKTYVSETWDYSGQVLTLPNSFMTFPSDSTSLAQANVAAVKVIPKQDYKIVRHLCQRRPDQAITQLEGKVNEFTFQMPDKTYGPETLRFDGANVGRQLTSARGYKFYEIAYSFAIQAVWDKIETGSFAYVGHNRVYRPDKGYWDRPKSTVGGRNIYEFDTTATPQTLRGRTISGFDMLFHQACV